MPYKLPAATDQSTEVIIKKGDYFWDQPLAEMDSAKKDEKKITVCSCYEAKLTLLFNIACVVKKS